MNSKKILIILSGFVIFYLIFSYKNAANKKSASKIETVYPEPKLINKLKPTLNPMIEEQPGPNTVPTAPVQKIQSNSSRPKLTDGATTEMSEIDKAIHKYAQIVPEYGDYEPTPKILTGDSAKMFSYTFPDQVMPEVELKNIKTAFEMGIYPPKNLILILGLNDIFDGTIYIDYELKYHVTWSLQINSNGDPVLGIFSLTMNDDETSCNSTIFGPLKNITLLSKEDNGTILVKSCDQRFFMQLYRHSMNTISGSYFERNTIKGQYETKGSVSMYRRSISN